MEMHGPSCRRMRHSWRSAVGAMESHGPSCRFTTHSCRFALSPMAMHVPSCRRIMHSCRFSILPMTAHGPSWADVKLESASKAAENRVNFMLGVEKRILRSNLEQKSILWIEGMCFIERAVLLHLILWGAVVRTCSSPIMYG